MGAPKIGIPKAHKLKTSDSGLVTYGETSLILSETEHKILNYLLENANTVVHASDLGDQIWDNVELYSQQAIVKYIERIRRKLKEAGIKKEFIYTKWGEGYILIS